MQPPAGLAPSSSTALQNGLSAFQTSTLSSSITMTSISLAYSIATAAVSANQTSTFLAAASSTAVADPDDESSGECKLLGPFAILVQGALGALALLSLVFKRWRERPQRPLKVWSFDASKQVVGSILLHLANLLMAMFSSGQIERAIAETAASTLGADITNTYQPNPCSFYLLNLAIDTTIGIPILIGILKILTIGASYTWLAKPLESIESGNYGTPPKTTWWLKQCLIYFLGLMGMKTCVFFIFQLCPWLGRVGDWALRWTEGNEAIQVAFVMLIFPLIMNALQYYIIDTFIKNNKGLPDEADQEAGHDEEEEHDGLLDGDTPGHGRSIDEDEACKGDETPTKPQFQSRTIASYDPDKDGEMDDHSRNGESSSLISHAEEEAIEHRPRV